MTIVAQLVSDSERAPLAPPGRLAVLRALGKGLLPFALPALVLLAWQIAAARQWVAPQILPAPAFVLATFVDLVRQGDLSTNLIVSLHRIAVGFALGAGAGLLIGGLIGLSERANRYLGPSLSIIAQIPALGWVPIFILIFGLDEILKYLIIAKATFIAVVIATADGIRSTPRSYIEVAHVLRLPRRYQLLRLWLPAAVPILFGGVRLGLNHAWIALITVEILAATEGVGYMMVWGRTLFQLDIVIAGMIVIGVIGLGLDRGLESIERRLSRWRPQHV